MEAMALTKGWQISNNSGVVCTGAALPVTVLSAMADAGLISEPYFGTNEDAAREMLYQDYVFGCDFRLTPELAAASGLILELDGICTLCEVRLNGQPLASLCNMHFTHKLDITGKTVEGLNRLELCFSSSACYAQAQAAAGEITHVPDNSLPGASYVRQAHFLFGWDWAPQLPDMGVVGSVCIGPAKRDAIVKLHNRQSFLPDFSQVMLELDIELELASEGSTLYAQLNSPEGIPVWQDCRPSTLREVLGCCVPGPRLWWPNGMGAQPLYTLRVWLEKQGTVLCEKSQRIGLRQLEVKTGKDQWGQEFAVEVNGRRVFCKGANWVPPDSILPRITTHRVRRLVEDCAAANFNCLRVWGGGVYPSDDFFDACDETGIMVWQDFMFACHVYPAQNSFLESVRKEIQHQVRRIEGHACLLLWCGNNEIEWMWQKEGGMNQSRDVEMHKAAYQELFEKLIPAVLAEEGATAFYWPSSPSSGGGFAEPNSPDKGNLHYWDVWHKVRPFTDYRTSYPRFCSEFGFQSFPSLETARGFAGEKECNMFSYTMERRQKNGAANQKILGYLSENYLYPSGFGNLVYISQIMQMEAIKCGVEHWRRHTGRCMGALYWQLNDSWPAISWSSIEYSGRWKALHYAARRFFAPVLLSVYEENGCLHGVLVNEGPVAFQGSARVCIKHKGFAMLEETEVPIEAAFCSSVAFTLPLQLMGPDAEQRREYFVEYSLHANGQMLSSDTLLLCPPKYFRWENPGLNCRVVEQDGGWAVAVQAAGYAKSVEISADGFGLLLEDNYFDISSAQERVVKIKRAGSVPPLQSICLRCVNTSY